MQNSRCQTGSKYRFLSPSRGRDIAQIAAQRLSDQLGPVDAVPCAARAFRPLAAPSNCTSGFKIALKQLKFLKNHRCFIIFHSFSPFVQLFNARFDTYRARSAWRRDFESPFGLPTHVDEEGGVASWPKVSTSIFQGLRPPFSCSSTPFEAASSPNKMLKNSRFKWK